MTTTTYQYPYFLSASPSTMLTITAFASCDTSAPQAYGAIVGGVGPFQICSNISATPVSGLTVQWDGSTITAASGFTVTYNGTVFPVFVGTTITTPQCSALPNGGNTVACKAPSKPSTWSKYKWYFIGGGIGLVFIIIMVIIVVVMMKRRKG